MNPALLLKRLMGRWHLSRADRSAVARPPDPADCGTAWGLELTLPPPVPPRGGPARPPR